MMQHVAKGSILSFSYLIQIIIKSHNNPMQENSMLSSCLMDKACIMGIFSNNDTKLRKVLSCLLCLDLRFFDMEEAWWPVAGGFLSSQLDHGLDSNLLVSIRCKVPSHPSPPRFFSFFLKESNSGLL